MRAYHVSIQQTVVPAIISTYDSPKLISYINSFFTANSAAPSCTYFFTIHSTEVVPILSTFDLTNHTSIRSTHPFPGKVCCFDRTYICYTTSNVAVGCSAVTVERADCVQCSKYIAVISGSSGFVWSIK